jgi:hypothetical protein
LSVEPLADCNELDKIVDSRPERRNACWRARSRAARTVASLATGILTTLGGGGLLPPPNSPDMDFSFLLD